MTKRYFERGGRGVFTCYTCHRSTRRTTQGSDSELCGICDELAMTENSVLDGAKVADVAEARDELVAECVAKGGDLETMKKYFSDLWEAA